MNERFNLTALDRQILRELQRDCRLSNQELAERIGSSASSVWRRVRQLQEAGVIEGFHLSIAADRLGLTETILLHISLHTHSDSAIDAFTRLINDSPEVLECYAVTGEYDYQLKVLATDMRAYYRFLEDRLMSKDFIARTSSTVVMKKIKDTETIPTD
jgi:DNA-binding Lrp family transcriptional regulator